MPGASAWNSSRRVRSVWDIACTGSSSESGSLGSNPGSGPHRLCDSGEDTRPLCAFTWGLGQHSSHGRLAAGIRATESAVIEQHTPGRPGRSRTETGDRRALRNARRGRQRRGSIGPAQIAPKHLWSVLQAPEFLCSGCSRVRRGPSHRLAARLGGLPGTRPPQQRGWGPPVLENAPSHLCQPGGCPRAVLVQGGQRGWRHSPGLFLGTRLWRNQG